MKSHLLTTVSFLALVSSAAAAELPVIKAPPAAMAPIWAGPYIGLNGGVVWHRMEGDFFEFGNFTHETTIRKTGATLGGQVGHNWQWENFVAAWKPT